MDEQNAVNDAGAGFEARPDTGYAAAGEDGGAREYQSAGGTQSPEENSRFANVRRQAEAQAKDQLISELYGKQGIHSYADYVKMQHATQQQQARRAESAQGITPQTVSQLVARHPDYQRAVAIVKDHQTNQALLGEFREAKEFFPGLSVDDIPPEAFILRHEEGLSLCDAMLRLEYSNMQKDTEQKVLKNLQKTTGSSPGSLSGEDASSQQGGYMNMEKKQFEKLKDRVLRGERA